MKNLKFLPLFLTLCLFLGLLCSPCTLAVDDPAIASPTALVLDRQTGEVLFSQGADQRIYPASTTKVMTMLLTVEAIEHGSVSLYDEVTATESAMQGMIPEGSSAGIVPGETMTLENLMYCAMISSANEACNIIAEHVSGSVDAFVAQMNDRADQLGCAHTHFANTHGLPDEQHYTTAADYSLIAMAAMNHPQFVKICSTDETVIPATNVSGERTLYNSNALVSPKSMYGSAYVYEGAKGIKTGHTNAAGYCLASAAARDDLDVLALVFGAPDSDTCFRDSAALLDWVFDNFSYQEILKSTVNIASVDIALGSDSDYVNLRPSTSITALLPNDVDLASFEKDIRVYSLENGELVTAPVTAGQVLGEVTLHRDGRNYGTVKLVASSTVELSRMQYIKSQLRETTQKKAFKLTVISLVLLFLLYLAWVILYRVRRLQHLRTVRAAEKAKTAPAVSSSKPQKPDIGFFSPGSAPAEKPAASAQKAQPKAAPEPAGDDLLRDAVCVAKLASPKAAPPKTESADDKSERDYFEEFFRK